MRFPAQPGCKCRVAPRTASCVCMAMFVGVPLPPPFVFQKLACMASRTAIIALLWHGCCVHDCPLQRLHMLVCTLQQLVVWRRICFVQARPCDSRTWDSTVKSTAESLLCDAFYRRCCVACILCRLHCSIDVVTIGWHTKTGTVCTVCTLVHWQCYLRPHAGAWGLVW